MLRTLAVGLGIMGRRLLVKSLYRFLPGLWFLGPEQSIFCLSDLPQALSFGFWESRFVIAMNL
jgi:hypothetical protein